MFYEINVEALRKKSCHDSLLTQLSQAQVNPDAFVLSETSRGDYTLQYQGHWLHAPGGAAEEATLICQQHCNSHPKAVHLLWGIGLGYLLEETHRTSPGTIIIYEPHLDLLRFVLENVNLATLLAAPNVRIVTNAASLHRALLDHYTHGSKLDFLMLMGYLPLIGNDIKTLLETTIQPLVSEKQNSMTVLHTYLQDWMQAFIHNLPHQITAHPFEVLINRFSDTPAVIVSAGPSLDLAIDALRDLQGKVVIIAVGRALRTLIANDIHPNYVVYFDFQGAPDQYANVSQDDLASLNFLVAPVSEKECFNQPVKNYYAYPLQNLPEFAAFTDEILGFEQTRLRAASTVSMMALFCAIAMGCNPLILVGQDLALAEGKQYAGKHTTDAAQHGELFDVPGQAGETLKTTQHYFWFLQHFQAFARENNAATKPLRLINASTGGAHIEGFDHIPLADIPELKNLTNISYKEDTPLAQDILDARRTRLHTTLAASKTRIEQALSQLVEESDTPLETINHLNHHLADDPLLTYALSKERWLLEQSPDAATQQTYLQNIQSILQTLKTWINHALA